MAAMPPADEARATTSNCAPGKFREVCGESAPSGSCERDTCWTNSSRSLGPCYPSNLVSALRPGKRSIGVMARVNTPSQPMTELYLIQGEMSDTRDLDDARQWVTIYRELVTFADRTLSRLRREKGGNMEADGSNASDADERGMEGHVRRLHSRLDVWPRRPAADERTSRVAITVRTHLSLLQGYADIMEGLSPELEREILCVMAEKARELGSALQPFVEQTPAARPAIDDYRRVRERTRL